MMSRCDICGRGPMFGKSVSHSHHKTNRRWNVNVQKVFVDSPSGGRKQVQMCTRCLRTQSKTKA
ncbi:MAG: 50S ribosomal protein L28 [Chloroflexota bacterium]|nr:50S ribosomal protein L28 [Chloroflexota bacterium]